MQRKSSIGLAILLSLGGAILISQAASIQEARTQYHAGKLAPALSQTNALLKENPQSISALFLKAQIQSENQQINKAIDTYKALIALDSGHLQAYNNLAALYAQQGKLPLASKTLEQAIRTDPVFTTIHTNLRAIYMDMSKKHYRQALKLKPENNSAQIASIDLNNNTDQILSNEIQVVPQSIQAAINTAVVSNAITTRRTAPVIDTSSAPIITQAAKEAEKPRELAEKKTAPKVVAKAEPKPKAVAKAEPKPKAVAKAEPKPKAVAKAKPKPKAVAKAKPKPKAVAKAEPKPKAVAKAEPKPKAVVKAEPKPEKKTPVVDPALEVKKALLSWANGWSNRDAKRYVSAYKNNYATKGKTHKDWVAGRRWNFKNKKYIKVSLSGINIKKSGKRYTVTFKQRYESNSYKDSVNKEITFISQNGQWKIAEETTK